MASTNWESRAGRIAAAVSRVRLGMVAAALTAGLFLAIAAAVAWMAAGVLLDLAVPLSVTQRVAVVGCWSLLVAVAGLAFVLLPLVRWPMLDTVSLQIERVLGGVHNRLLTVVDLARGGRARADLAPEMVERLLDQTQARLAGFRVWQVVRWQAVLRNAGAALVAVGLIVALWLALGDRLIVTLRRFLQPTADIPPATWLQLVAPGDLAVLAGDPLDIVGRVARGSVDALELVLFDEEGRPLRFPMRPAAEGGFVTRLDGLDRASSYRLEGGGTWTQTHAISILRRPEITGLRRSIRLPAYMRIDASEPVADDIQRIEAPAGATIEFAATVSADATTGQLQLFERTLEQREVERLDERVWFEDDLPRDAVTEVPWKWTTTHAAGGLRSFTFGFDGKPFGMRTRLEPLALPHDHLPRRAVMLMARLDPADAPTHLGMCLEHDRTRVELVWGDPAAIPPPPGVQRVVAGPLPAPGEWRRLEAGLQALPQLAGLSVTAARFSVDRGRVLLDRPGWIERTTESAQQAVDRPIGERVLQPTATVVAPADASGSREWIGGVPVEAPVWATVAFQSSAGHGSLPASATEIVPTTDRPPSIVVDAPAEMLALEAPDDVEIVGHVFDDWGLDGIAVRIGPDPQHLGPPAPLEGVTLTERPPDTQLALTTVLTADRLGLAPGSSAAWCLVARDTKGQETQSKVYRISVVLPPEMALARTQVPALEQARREAKQAAVAAERQATQVDGRRTAVLEAVGAEPLEAFATARQARAAQDGAEPRMQPPAPAAEEDSRGAAATALTRDATAATAVAQQSADEAVRNLAPPRRGDLAAVDAQLSQRNHEAGRLAKTIAQAAAQAAKSPLVPSPQQERLAALAAEAGALQQSLARDDAFKGEAAKLERVDAAPTHARIAEQVRGLETALDDVARRLDAAGAARRLDALAADLESRREAVAAPQEPAGAAPSSPQRPGSADRSEREQIRQIEQILGPQGRSLAKSRQTPAAGVADVPEQAATPQPAAAPAQPEQPTAAAAAAAEAGTISRLAAELAAQLAGRQPIPPADGPADGPDGTAPPGAVAAAAEPDEAASSEPLAALLASAPVQQTLQMAERARLLQQRAAREAARQAARRPSNSVPSPSAQAGNSGPPADPAPGLPAGESVAELTDGGAVTGQTAVADPLRGLDAGRRAALYKLPPRVRDPLLEGMRLRGPEAYQEVIDTYFRQLGREISP